ncbi:hypothetical protein ACFXHD_18775 [Streptomyces hydrogenans]|uniref:hypothetical protein n=1 Tax=Streptomyces hydrogenans TaxID=1873719 RepID=UPI0035D69D57
MQRPTRRPRPAFPHRTQQRSTTMTPHFTDRDERLWQRHAEERPARPLPVGAWLRTLRATLRTHRPASRTTEGAT